MLCCTLDDVRLGSLDCNECNRGATKKIFDAGDDGEGMIQSLIHCVGQTVSAYI